VTRRIRSLQLRLTLELTALFVIASALALGGLIYNASLTAYTLADRDLGLRAEDLAAHIVREDGGAPRLDLPPALTQAYADASAVFAVRDKEGRLIAASTPAFGSASARWPAGDGDPTYFQLSKFGPLRQDYAGLSVQTASAAGPISVAVAQRAGSDQLVHAILREFVIDTGWYVPPFAAITLLLAVYRVRRSLRPLRAASDRARAIGPEAISLRLPVTDVPAEALPLVTAVNRALDRLEQGFMVQRRFTADAAHQLRTPLAIITARLDTLPGNGQIEALREEVARMNRLVEQLLCVARLDSLALDVTQAVDLRAIAAEVVGSMAHLALAAGKSIALTGDERPVMIAGNAPAIADALRNLIENALAYTPAGTEVIVEVAADGTVSVSDSGPGVPAEDRLRIFDRFWRGQGSTRGGAGLGLPIVGEIVKAHGASVLVEDGAAQGARFTMRFALHRTVKANVTPARISPAV
jgi:signal transduction histidine kinase